MKKSLFTAFAVGLCLSANLMAQVPSYVPANGLVGWWPFNGNANDECGNGNNGTVNGATLTADRFGNSNKAYSFDGSSNYISVLDNPSLDVSNVSVSAWYWAIDYGTPQQQSQGHIVSKREQTGWGNAFQLAVEQTTPINGIWATYTIGSNGWVGYNSNSQLDTQNWIHVVYTHDNDSAKLFINGDLVNTTIISGGLNINDLPLWFGARPNAGANSAFFHGTLDDIGIWNRALTPQEITDLYNGCSSSMITTQPTNQTVNPTNAAQFVASSNSGSTFQWQTDLGVGFQNLSNAGQYTGANNDTLVVLNASVSNNNQQFRCIVNSGSCSDTSDIAVLTVSSVGIEEMMNQVNFNLFPNPTQSSFEIQTNLVYTKIQIRDMQGRIVKTENVGKIINIASLQKGTYLVQLLDEKSKVVAVQRVIKE